jgi:di- and tripeptidase
VRKPTVEEEKLFSELEFNMDKYKNLSGVSSLKSTNVKELLTKRWCSPSLSIVRVESSDGKGSIISRQVRGQICIRHVPDQTTQQLIELVTDYIKEKFNTLASCNQISIKTLHTGDVWLGDRTNKYYKMAAQCLREEWKIEPMFVREGGSIPVTPFLESTLNAPALHFPLGQASDRAHLQNERIRLQNLIKGKEVLKNFFKALAKK